MDEDIFCTALSHQVDGSIYVVGGNGYECKAQGLPYTHSFNPFDGSWTRLTT